MDKFNRHNSRSEGGFTLIEILVVVIIVGILGSIAAPGWLSFLERQRANNVKSDLLSALREVQEDAKQQSTGRTVTFRTTAAGPTIEVAANSSGNVMTQALGSNAKSIKLKHFVGGNLDPADNTPSDSVAFDYKGGVSTVPFVVQIGTDENPAQKCLIITTLLGGIAEGSGAECINPDPKA